MIIAMKIAAMWGMASIAFGLAVGPFLRSAQTRSTTRSTGDAAA
jgi:hypothetical protein